MTNLWFALAIGNSRLHWARFTSGELRETWDESYQQELGVRLRRGFDDELSRIERSAERSQESRGENEKFGSKGLGNQETGDRRQEPERENERLVIRGLENFQDLEVPLWIASVVPEQTRRWMAYPQARLLTLEDVPLTGMYPTLGIDRALALWGAITTLGSPALVIDCGTALTFTGADQNHQFVGGAILPGLRLQFEALGQKTALLPTLDRDSPSPTATPLMVRWAKSTEAAIASGILNTIIAGIQAFAQDWRRQFPNSRIVLTGGDSDQLYCHLQKTSLEMVDYMVVDNQLIFRGIQAIQSTQG